MLKSLNGIRLVRFEPEYHTVKLYEWYYSGDYPEYYCEYPQCPSALELAAGAQGKTLMIIRESDDVILGMASYFNVRESSRNFEISFLIEKQFQKMGYALDAVKIFLNLLFNSCNFYKASMHVMARDVRLCELLEKFGAFREGGEKAMLKNHVYLEGEYNNVVVYAMFKKAFNDLYKKDLHKGPRLEVLPPFKPHESRLETSNNESLHGRYSGVSSYTL